MYGVLCVWCACGMLVACVWHMYVCVVCVLFVYVVGNMCVRVGVVCVCMCVWHMCCVWVCVKGVCVVGVGNVCRVEVLCVCVCGGKVHQSKWGRDVNNWRISVKGTWQFPAILLTFL